MRGRFWGCVRLYMSMCLCGCLSACLGVLCSCLRSCFSAKETAVKGEEGVGGGQGVAARVVVVALG